MSQHLGLRLLQASLNMRRKLNRLAEFGSLTQGEYLVLRHMWLAERAGKMPAGKGRSRRQSSLNSWKGPGLQSPAYSMTWKREG